MPILHQVSTEVRYQRGFTYYDKCGSIMLKLQDELGKGFRGSVPDMRYGELASPIDRTTVRYGHANMTVTQVWGGAASRVTQLAPRVWKLVGDAIEVKNQVIRVGLRVWWMWPMETRDQADEAVKKIGFMPTTEQLGALLGDGKTPRAPTVAAVTKVDAETELRFILSTADVDRDHAALANGGEEVPGLTEHAVMLDLDFFWNPEDGQSAWQGELASFLKRGWAEAVSIKDRLEGKLSNG